MQGYTEPRPCSGLDLEQQHAQQTQRTQNTTHQPPRSRRSHYPSSEMPALWRGSSSPEGKSRRHVTRKHNEKWGSAHFSAEMHQTKRTRSSVQVWSHSTVHCPLFNLESILSEQLSLFDHMREQSAHVSQPLVSSEKDLADRRVVLLQSTCQTQLGKTRTPVSLWCIYWSMKGCEGLISALCAPGAQTSFLQSRS